MADSGISASTPVMQIRHKDEANPMAWDERLAVKAQRMFSLDPGVSRKSLYQENNFEEEPKKRKSSRFSFRNDARRINCNSDNEPQQFRFEPTTNNSTNSFLRRIFLLHSPSNPSESFSTLLGLNGTISYYLHCMFRGDFCLVVTGMCFAFFCLVFVFSILIAIAGAVDNECIVVGGYPYNGHGNGFAEAFGLSWVTFSTVGYGTSYPALSNQNSNWADCFFVSFLCSFEAFTGIMFGGFCGAILFGKVLRMQSDACITFSDPIVIRFGHGLCTDASCIVESNDEFNEKDPPFPVLEFRIVNQLWNEAGSEILDASLSVVANIDEDVDLDSDNNSINSSMKNNHFLRTGSSFSTSTTSTNGHEHKHFLTKGRIRQNLFHSHVAMEDVPSTRTSARHVYMRMQMETNEHPYFNRVWVVRHRLDGNSPLLRNHDRKEIRRNGGKWPLKLNNAKAIRKAINFNAILASLNGVANMSASAVYAQKIYNYGDIHIGYRFVNILYRNADDKSLGVDLELINDIQEQHGGGAEPLITVDE